MRRMTDPADTSPSNAPGPDGAEAPPLAAFWDLPAERRGELLRRGIVRGHAWHFERNRAYRRTVEARGVGPQVSTADLPRLLRPTAQAFKSYIEVLGTPFPQERPREFLEWLADQLSVELPRERFAGFRPRYGSLEALLRAVESQFADLGLEVLTSSGTSGRSTIIVRDAAATDATVESFYLAFRRYLGMRAEHRAIFLMPARTRIAMARMARFSVQRVGLPADQVHFAIPLPAYPDQVRIRNGRTFRSGWRGDLERRTLHPAMRAAQERLVDGLATRRALALLEHAARDREKVLLFGSPVQLHRLALALLAAGRTLTLAPGSLFGSGGGMKEQYPASPAEIRADVQRVARFPDGRPVPLRDVYGMAEANWAAMQCAAGNYHIPPWVGALTLDDERPLQGPQTTGMLAFFDPYGGGRLFPAFFKTADRVTLVTGEGTWRCPCGEAGAYLTHDSIQRVDLIGEAGCAAQI
jgi:hypothetical protein